MNNPHSLQCNIDLILSHPMQAQNLFNTIKRNKEFLTQHMEWMVNFKSYEDVENYLTKCVNMQNEGLEKTFYLFDQNTIIGCVSLHQIDLYNQSASLGYWLIQSMQGKGIMNQALTYLINISFKKLNLNRIEILSNVQNIRSTAIAIRLGFKKEGILRQAQKQGKLFNDIHIYSILKQEWIDRKTPYTTH